MSRQNVNFVAVFVIVVAVVGFAAHKSQKFARAKLIKKRMKIKILTCRKPKLKAKRNKKFLISDLYVCVCARVNKQNYKSQTSRRRVGQAEKVVGRPSGASVVTGQTATETEVRNAIRGHSVNAVVVVLYFAVQRRCKPYFD